MKRIYSHGTPRERFEKHLLREGDCIVWNGSRTKRGYGRFRFDGEARNANRVAWELYVGPIPFGLFVCHKCNNPPCVRVEHLYLATSAENTKDAVRDGIKVGRPEKPLCPKGHLKVRRLNQKTRLRCLQCHAEQERRHKEARYGTR
jgi:hypothetical protein